MLIHRRMLALAGPIWWQVGATVLVSLAMSATLIGQAFLVSALLVALYGGAAFA